MKQAILFIIIIFFSCKQNEVAFFKSPEQINDGIQTGAMKDARIDEEYIKLLQDSITAGIYPNIHSILILRNNRLVYEHYWAGHDENRKTNFVGHTLHHRDSLHDIRSITKNITSAAVMIALDQGKIQNLDQQLFEFFPEFSKYAEGKKNDITIRHLLTMTSGLNWKESYNDSLKIHDVSYAIDYILRQPLVEIPGSKFSYNSASTQLLAQIIEKTTGMDIEIFTGKHLFGPLGINNFEWTKEKNGLISAWAGLRLSSRDMMKFGMLYLNNGKWNEKQIISSNLVDESTRRHIYSEEPYGYGYSSGLWLIVFKISQ
jgi:CubicO group peptidase (beta-lactamase class C family)